MELYSKHTLLSQGLLYSTPQCLIAREAKNKERFKAGSSHYSVITGITSSRNAAAERSIPLNPSETKVLNSEDFWGILNAELMDGSISRGSRQVKAPLRVTDKLSLNVTVPE